MPVNFYVHYTVKTSSTAKPQTCKEGPYTADDAIDKRRERAAGQGVIEAHIEEGE